jgi:hypothetical protein
MASSPAAIPGSPAAAAPSSSTDVSFWRTRGSVGVNNTTSVENGEAMQASSPGSSSVAMGFSKQGSRLGLSVPAQDQASGREGSATEPPSHTPLSLPTTLRSGLNPPSTYGRT